MKQKWKARQPRTRGSLSIGGLLADSFGINQSRCTLRRARWPNGEGVEGIEKSRRKWNEKKSKKETSKDQLYFRTFRHGLFIREGGKNRNDGQGLWRNSKGISRSRGLGPVHPLSRDFSNPPPRRALIYDRPSDQPAARTRPEYKSRKIYTAAACVRARRRMIPIPEPDITRCRNHTNVKNLRANRRGGERGNVRKTLRSLANFGNVRSADKSRVDFCNRGSSQFFTAISLQFSLTRGSFHRWNEKLIAQYTFTKKSWHTFYS